MNANQFKTYDYDVGNLPQEKFDYIISQYLENLTGRIRGRGGQKILTQNQANCSGILANFGQF